MTATLGTKTWKRFSGELLAAVDREFERAILTPARAFWPALVQPRGMAAYDRAGADLVAFKEEGGIEAVIQCKGFFKAEGLQNDQLAAFEKSIRSFDESGLTTDTYAVVHNQDARNRDVSQKIDSALQTLVKKGKAKRVIQWDRIAFLHALEGRLREMVGARIGEESVLMLDQLDQQFAYGRTYVPDVPVSHRNLTLRRGQPPLIRAMGASRQSTNIAESLTRATRRWTLLTGLFGTGKTSAALHAARMSPQRILYVHAGSIEPRYGEGGTNTLMGRIVEALSVFGDFEADERGLFERLAGPMLRQLLQAGDTDALLILDALDENRSLGSPEAMTRFASSLAELRCPIIMTTREEHFRATFGNFDHLFDELSTKGGNARDVTLLELQPWTEREVLAFTRASAAETPDNRHLTALNEKLAAGGDGGWGVEFLRHPLFLRMIVDLAAEGGDPSRTRSGLIASWVWAKLTRDLKSARATPVPVEDRNLFLENMERVMTAAAAAMVEEDEAGIRLRDTIGSNQLVALCEAAFATGGVDLGRAISVSLLVPVAVRHRSEVPLRFTHRAFQEFFLARHLVESGVAPDRFPGEVRQFHAEMSASSA
jgi:hypothetical protein